MSSLTEAKLLRRMAWRVMTEKKHSMRLGHEQLVGATCSVIRWFSGLASQARTSACLWDVVVADHVQLLARVAAATLVRKVRNSPCRWWG